MLELRLEAFTKLSSDDRASIDRISRKGIRNYAMRRDLIAEGDRPKSVFLMLEGWACRYKQLPDGRRQIVAFFIPGDLGDMEVYILKEMDHSVGALTKVRAAEISREDFDRLMIDHPRITQALHWDMLVTVAVQREWTLNIGQRTAYERLAHLFCELFLRLRTVGLTNGDTCDFPITQTDLAEATGLTSVHVNRMLQDLRRDGLIELQNRQLRVPDLAALMDVAMFTPNYLHLDHEGRNLDANN